MHAQPQGHGTQNASHDDGDDHDDDDDADTAMIIFCFDLLNMFVPIFSLRDQSLWNAEWAKPLQMEKHAVQVGRNLLKCKRMLHLSLIHI